MTGQQASRPRILVAGIGNVFLADDGFGVEVVRRVRESGELPAGVELVDTGIRGIHLAYQLLDGYDVLLLVDTISRGEPPGTLYTLEHDLDARPATAPPLDGHGMDPASVLDLLDGLAGSMGVARPVGRVLVIGCEPADLTEHLGLSPPVADAVDPAARAVVELVTDLARRAAGDEAPEQTRPDARPEDREEEGSRR